ncbi:hypothetical protein XELAEV_18036966mg, partial [Xenopus laevis]
MSFTDIAATTDLRADTFGYTEAERKRILNASYTLPAFTPPEDTDYIRELEKLKRREVTWLLHSSTLTEYAKVQRIPRGLRVYLKPVLFREDREFLSKWRGILNRCSLDLITLTIQQLNAGLKDVRQQIHAAEESIKLKETSALCEQKLRELQTEIDKLQQEILQNKLRKFRRDTRDYEKEEVYSWKDGKNQQRQRPRKFPASTERTYSQQSSELDSSASSSFQASPAFLGRSQQHRRGKRAKT